MSKVTELEGSIVALVTPFSDDGGVDYEAFEKLLAFHLAQGTDGLLVCGTTGETPTLAESEYVELIARAAAAARGRIPVIAGAGANATAKTIRNCEAAAGAGAEALLIVGPYYNKPTPAGFFEHYAAVARATSLPLLVYNVPGRTGKNIPTEVLLALAEKFDHVVAVKEASGDLSQIMDLLARRPPGFRVYSGDDALAFPLMALGAEGCISVVANEIPKEFARLIRSAREGDFATARALHYRYLPLMNLNFLESNPIPVKTALSLMGLVGENFRLPMCPMESRHKEVLAAELKRLGLIT